MGNAVFRELRVAFAGVESIEGRDTLQNISETLWLAIMELLYLFQIVLDLSPYYKAGHTRSVLTKHSKLSVKTDWCEGVSSQLSRTDSLTELGY